VVGSKILAHVLVGVRRKSVRLGGTAMKRLVFALALATLAAAAQAQTAGERALNPSRENPSLVAALRHWLATKTASVSKTAPKAATTHAAEAGPRHPAEAYQHHRSYARHHKVPETEAPKSATVAPAAPAAPAAPVAPLMTTASAAPIPSAAPAEPAATPALASVNPNMPRTVATITVVPPAPSIVPPHHGRSECASGERIITAFYWEGKYTATGARFDPDGMTAAHRTFPFGTKLLVINPRNGKSVTVTVNDRGPFTRGVTLDLSRGAAKAIGLQGNAAVCMAKM
jgi:rare lipoprotein A (peptidoglycan hydrolase)